MRGELIRRELDIGPISVSSALDAPTKLLRGLTFGIQNQTLDTSNPLKFETGVLLLGPVTLGLRVTRR